jgi:hypothetical protein
MEQKSAGIAAAFPDQSAGNPPITSFGSGEIRHGETGVDPYRHKTGPKSEHDTRLKAVRHG